MVSKNENENFLDKVKDKVTEVVDEFKTGSEEDDKVEEVGYTDESEAETKDKVNDIPVERFDDEGDVNVSEVYVETEYVDEGVIDDIENVSYDSRVDEVIEGENLGLSEEDYARYEREDTLKDDLDMDTKNNGLNRDNEKL